MATIFNNIKSNGASPYAYYTVWATVNTRNENSVVLDVYMNARLASSGSSLGTGSTMGLDVYFNFAETGQTSAWRIKATNTSWSGTSNHRIPSSGTRQYTVTVSPSATSVSTKIKVNRTGSAANTTDTGKGCWVAWRSGTALSIDAWKYTITPAKGTGISSVSGGGSVAAGSSVSLSASVSTGYSWSGWYNGDTLVSTANPYSFTASSTITLTAKANLNYFNVTVNKGTGISAVSGGGSKGYGSSVSVSATVSTGYSWSGWTGTYSSSSNPYTFTMPNQAVSLTANANINTYTNVIEHWTWGYLHGEGNNGDKNAFKLGNTTFNQTYNSNYTMDASRKMTIPNGFYLDNTFGTSSISGSWAKYNMGTSVTQKAAVMSYEYDYRPYTYNITYVMNGGTNPSTNPTTYNVLYGVTFANPSRSGYNFVNWTINGSSVTGINPGANASFTSPDDLYNKCAARTIGDKTVVANWIEIAPSNVQINGTAVSSTQIDLNWSATGENISKYILYYKLSTSSSYSSIDCGTNTSYSFTAESGKTYNFYIAAINPGGTTNSTVINITTPEEIKANISIKVLNVWKTGSPWVKINGVWKKAKKAYIKQNGEWKESK